MTMKKLIVQFSFCLLAILVLFGCSGKEPRPPYLEAQQKWAEKYNVKIEDYPYPYAFPVYYFDKNLKSGDSIEKVHEVIIGYEKVYHCGHWAEVYYFFSSDSSKALRFMVLYDDNSRYQDITITDESSSVIGSDCIAEGIIEGK